MKRLLFLLLLWPLLLAAERPDRMVLGHEDQNAYPWVMPVPGGYAGLDLELLKLLEMRLGVVIETRAYPWIRALVTMQSGEIDGVFAASYKQDREVFGLYPQQGGRLDASRRIHTSGYSLYLLKDSGVEFDGRKFTNLRSTLGATQIGVQRAFSIIPSLQQLEVELNDQTSDPAKILELLYHGRLAAAAIQTARADSLIAANPDWRAKIVKYATSKEPFHQKPYFVMLSRQFVERYPQFSQEFWDTLAALRDSPAFAGIEAEFYSR